MAAERRAFTFSVLSRGRLEPGETAKPKQPDKLSAEKLTPEEQRRRFIKTAREAGASKDEADFDTVLKQIARPKKPA